MSEPETLDKLLACHDKVAKEFKAQWKKDKRKGSLDAAYEKLRDFQLEEVRGYLSRDPDRAHVGYTEGDEDEVEPLASEDASEDGAPKEGAAEDSSNMDVELKQLNSLLETSSDGGKKGITPGAASAIRALLMKKQGSISPQMSELLEAVEKDGGNLTDDTIKKLQRATKAAKGAGLDLKIPKDVEKDLLGPEVVPPGT